MTDKIADSFLQVVRTLISHLLISIKGSFWIYVMKVLAKLEELS